jgi:6-phosphogluconolactonase
MNGQYQELGGERLVYVGTYTGEGSEGIHVCRLDLSTGELRHSGVPTKIDNPSYLAIDSEGRRLYAVSEYMDSGELPGGGVSAFAVQPSSGALSLINQKPSHGRAPCYLTLDHSGRYLFVVNYVGGRVAMFPIGEDGALGEPTDIVTHVGSGPHPERQDGPHPHSIVLDSENNYAFVPDLGLDKVLQYRIERAAGRLLPNRPPWVEAEPGSGPRHMVFHHGMSVAYVINELSSTVSAYTYDSGQGRLEPFQTTPTVPEGYSAPNLAADLHLAPNGRVLYGTNRGHDSLAFYSVDQETGWLTNLGWVPSLGKTPRGFAVDPSGTFILVANQDSHNIVSFRVSGNHGLISPTGHVLSVPSPVCIKFAPS